MKKTNEITLIGILAGVNIVSRVMLQALPNIKPVTSIIILSVLLFGLSFGVKLAVVTTVVSNIFLGMGIWTFFQLLAWVIICLLSDVIAQIYKKRGTSPNLYLMAVFAFFMGYVFGFIVSLDKLIIGGPTMFILYYLAGLVFDTFHAAGNFVFYLICSPLLIVATKHLKEKHQELG
jgi:energy-coupling factor transport system substrate-specific component